MGRKKRRRRADRERASERDSADDEAEHDAASALGTPLGMPDAPIPDSPMPDAPIPDAGVPDMGNAHIQRTKQETGNPEQNQSTGGQPLDSITVDSSRSISPDEERIVQKFLNLSELSDEEIETVADIFDIADPDEIRHASERIGWIREHRRRITRVLSGTSANQEDRYPDWYEDPHEPDSLVIEFENSSEEMVLLRAHGEENQNGYWLIPPRDVGGVDIEDVPDLTADDVSEALALPEPPKYISKVTIPSNTPMRISSIKENFGSSGTWPQIELENHLDDDAYEIIRAFAAPARESEVNE